MTVWKIALAGVVIAGLLWAGGRESVGAQSQECVEAMNWELQSGSFGAGSFYAIKLNRCTGATVVLLEHSEIPGERWTCPGFVDGYGLGFQALCCGNCLLS